MKITIKLTALITAAACMLGGIRAQACSRVVYLGTDSLVITGRTMDWAEDIHSNIYIFPRGIKRVSHDKLKHIEWISRYGSLATGAYDLGTSDGMNEKGLVTNLLYLTESSYGRPNDNRPAMGIGIWAQYVLDNFATVREAVDELQEENFYIDAPTLPNGSATTMHLSISDATGNSAILEYIDGKLTIHEGSQYQVLTNSPRYDLQLAINDYWAAKNGLNVLPGTNNSSDRFARASFYIKAIPQTADPKLAVPGVLSVIRNVSVPFGISTPDKPHISTTRWRSVANQKDKVYYFETTLTPNLFWLDLNTLDLREGAAPKKLSLTNGEVYVGNAAPALRDGTLHFLFELPPMPATR